MSEYNVSPRLEGTTVVLDITRDGESIATLRTENESAYNAAHALKADLATLLALTFEEGVRSATILPPGSTGGS